MQIKKTHLILGLILLGLVFVAIYGFNLWNSQIVSNLAKISQFSFYLILAFAFFAGIVSFFSPCGLALSPVFISYNMALVNEQSKNLKTQIFKIGIFSALGIITFYIILGIVFSLFGAVIDPYIQVFQYIIAILFVVFGVMMVRNFSLSNKLFNSIRKKVHFHAMKQTGYKGFYIFGFAYGIDIIGCLFPLIATLILIPIATGNFILGVSAFISYSIALAVMMTIFAYLIAFSKKSLVSDVVKSTEKLKVWIGTGLIFGGLALLWYYTFYGMRVG